MTYPTGLILRTVKAGAAFGGGTGDAYGVDVTLTPDKYMVWAATGQPAVIDDGKIVASDGAEGAANFVCTDQGGWEDGHGGVYEPDADGHYFLYNVVYQITKNGKKFGKPVISNTLYALPQGDGSPVDIDLLIASTTDDGGTTVLIPDTWAAQIAEAVAAAEAAEAAMVDSESFVGSQAASGKPLRVALDSTYVTRKRTRVIVSVGQSNEVGAGLDPVAGFDDIADSRIFMWNGTAIVAATEPLKWPHDPTPGFGHTFLLAKLYADRTGDSILVVPVAMSGTTFEGPNLSPSTYSSTWKKGLAPASGGFQLYNEAVSAVNAAMTAAALLGMVTLDFIVCGSLGESDGAISTPSATFQSDLDTFIDNLRADLTGASAATPFLLGPMVPEGVVAVAGRIPINVVHIDTPRRKLRTSFFPGPANSYRTYLGSPDTTHYNAAGQRTIAQRFLDSLDRARANILGAAAVAPSNVQATVSGTTATITWDAPKSRVTGYVVQVSGVTDTGFVTQTRTATDISTTQTITGLTSGVVFQVQVASVNEGGQSAFTVPLTSAAITVPTPAVAQLSSSSATVSWSANPLANAYRLDYKLSSASVWTAGTPQSSTLTSITGLTAANYEFRLTVFTAFGTTTGAVVTANIAAQPISGLTVTPFRAAGLRKVLSTWTGPLVRVRRSTDNAEADIGSLAGGGLDISALTTHVGSGDGYATVLYDQSGGGNNLSQAAVGYQPKIVAAGAVITLNGHPALQFDGTDDHLFSATATAFSSGAASFCLVTQGTPASGAAIFAERNATTSGRYFPVESWRTDGRVDARILNDAGAGVTEDASGYTPAAFAAVAGQTTVVDTGTTITFRVNAAQVGTKTYARSGTTTTFTKASIGAAITTGPTQPAAIKMSEFIEMHSALVTADQNAIESNQKAYYGTP